MRNRLLVRRNQADPGGPAYLVGQACQVDPGDLVCPASRVYRADPVGQDDRAYRGAMACPASTACRAGGRGRAKGGRARGGRGNRPYRRMR